jgi:hypothetical protein
VLQKTDFISALERGSCFSKLKKFENTIEKGELLVLLDIPMDRIGVITQIIIKHHSNAEFGGIEPILPLFY